MITTKGRSLLLQYLTGFVQSWAGAIEVGIGQTSPTTEDISLDFPFRRFPIDNMDYDEVNNKVIVRATIPQDVSTGIYEIGLFSAENFPEPIVGNRILLNYTDGISIYSTDIGTYTNENVRLGDEGMLLSHASGTGFIRGYITSSLFEYNGSSEFNLAYNSVGTAPVTTVRFETTSSDYFEHSFTPIDGSNIETFTKESVASTGNPLWSSIDSIVISTAAGVAELTLDGIMIEDSVTFSNYGMVAREVLSSPRIKPSGIEAEITIEIELGF
jgi:hypothetical protein